MATPENDLLAGLIANAGSAPSPVVRPAPVRTAPPRTSGGMLDWFAPQWALRAERQIATLPGGVRSLMLLVSVLVFAVGFVMAVGGGYWSIQGVRLALAWLGVSVALVGIPAAPWWLIPIGNTLIQVMARRIPAIRATLWTPSVLFGSITTGIFMGLLLLPGMHQLVPRSPILATGVVAAILGMALEVLVEHIVFGALVLVRACTR